MPPTTSPIEAPPQHATFEFKTLTPGSKNEPAPGFVLEGLRPKDYVLPTTIGMELEVNFALSDPNPYGGNWKHIHPPGFTIGHDHCGFEARSKVMTTWGDICNITPLLEAYHRAGCKTTVECGMHVHIGMFGLGSGLLEAKFLACLQVYSDLFINMVPAHRIFNSFCNTPNLTAYHAAAKIWKNLTIPALLESPPRILPVEGPAARVAPHFYGSYPWLRDQRRSVLSFDTLEIRLFHSSLLKSEVYMNIILVLLFVEKFKRDPDAFLKECREYLDTMVCRPHPGGHYEEVSRTGGYNTCSDELYTRAGRNSGLLDLLFSNPTCASLEAQLRTAYGLRRRSGGACLNLPDDYFTAPVA